MTPAIPNRPRLEDVRHMPAGEIARLPAEHLALLQEEATNHIESVKRLKDWIDGVIALRYGERASALRAAQGKDTGTVRFEDDGVTIVADLPKKVEWDQVQLAALVEKITASGDNPAEYITTEFKVSERAYGAWPERIRQVFAPARTVRTGKPALILKLHGMHE